MIKTFRGQLADGEQETIRLSTVRGQIGYRIVKFQLMCVQPGLGNQESIAQLFTNEQATVPTSAGIVDFDNSELLAAAIFTASTNQKTDPEDLAVIFDHVKFNQDIYITHTDNEGALPINYYLELEQTKLDINEATVATMKDMRGTN